MDADAQFDGEALYGVGDRVDATLRVPDPAGQLDVGDDAEGSGCGVGAGADVGGKAAEQLAQVRGMDPAADGLVHGQPWIYAQHIGRGHAEKGAQGRRLAVDENRPRDAVEAGGVLEKVKVALHVARVEALDLGGHAAYVAGGVEHCAVAVEVACQRVDGEQCQVVVEAAAGSGEKLLKNWAHGDDRGASVPAEAVLNNLAHLPADNGVLFVYGDTATGGSEADGGAEAANAGADDGHIGVFVRRRR